MLDFFRRYQRYFFYVITVVIVISFSFFGTYSSLSDGSFREQIAFTTVKGTPVTRHDLDEMVTFLGTDIEDKVLLGGGWGPNFLNDGVIKNDFLKTGLASMLAAEYAAEILPDLQTRLEREKNFQFYSHPQAPFINTESAWNYFSTGISQKLAALRRAHDPIQNDAFEARVALFLGEKQFPALFLRQVLRSQEQQHSWLTPDPNLNHVDLSLFGYHTAEDWFGPRFMRIIAQFIINAAAIAEQKGYSVSKPDALADLILHSERSFKQNMKNPHLDVANGSEYFHEQLRRLGMDQSKAAKIWGQVLLFRRLFQDMGSSAFVDPLMLQGLNTYALASVEGELFRLPKELRLASFGSLQKFEVYLDVVSKRSQNDLLALPTTFLTPEQVSRKVPELVQKRYLLEIAEVDKKNLQVKVGIKQTWNWETDAKNWELLKKQFPELGLVKSDTREERFVALESLNNQTRARVDAFARELIVDAHPEWLQEALTEAQAKRSLVGLSEKGSKLPVIGLDNGKELMQLLDQAPLGKVLSSDQDLTGLSESAKNAAEKLASFSGNGEIFYRIHVIDRANSPHILTFAEAEREGVLNKLLDRQLEAYYLKIRENNSKDFQLEDKSWKPLSEVKATVANKYFEKTIQAIQQAYAAAIAPQPAPAEMIGDFAATLRFYSYVQHVEEKIRNQPALAAELTQEVEQSTSEKKSLGEQLSLADQWKMERMPYKATRSTVEGLVNKTEVFLLADGSWTKVHSPANGDLSFFHLERKGDEVDEKALNDKVSQVQRLLSDEAQQQLMRSLLQKIKSKQAISLDYLNQVAEAEMVNPD